MSCKSCHSVIPRGASVCPICRSYQSALRERFQFLSTSAALITLILSGTAFLATVGEKVWRENHWRDEFKIVKFASDARSVFVNTGDGDLYLLQADLDSTAYGFRQTVALDKTCEKGQVCTIDSHLPEIKGMYLSVAEAAEKELHTLHLKGEIAPVFFDSNSVALSVVHKSMQGDLVCLPAQGIVRAVSAHDGHPVLLEFKAELLFIRIAAIPPP